MAEACVLRGGASQEWTQCLGAAREVLGLAPRTRMRFSHVGGMEGGLQASEQW